MNKVILKNSPSRINAKIEEEIVKRIEKLAIEEVDVTWPRILDEIGKVGYIFSRQALSARAKIKKAYNRAQAPSANTALENRYKSHTKAHLAKQLKKAKADVDQAREENERILTLYAFLFQHVSEKFPTAMSEIEETLKERLTLSEHSR